MKLDIKFKFDEKIKKGDYSAKYFLVTKNILESEKKEETSLLRFKHFSDNVVVAGIQESLQLIKFCLPKKIYDKLKIYYLEDGTITNSCQPILAIEGKYSDFAFLENIIDGILSRRSSIATNVKRIVDLIGSQKIIYMADRSDDYSLQAYDGYAAYIGGVKTFVTKQHASFLKKDKNVNVVGTIPHALIQQYNGDLYSALIAYKKVNKKGKVIALIDFYNNCVDEIKKLKEKGLKQLDYVRIDTSSSLIDESLKDLYQKTSDKSLYGVNDKLIKNVRNELDRLGYKNTKIIISSSLNYEKIKNYLDKKTPIDVFGVGKSFLNININFTADLVKTNNKYFAKTGRDQNIDKYLKKMKTIN